MADICGIEKILKYCEKYDFQRIVLKKGSDTIYTKRCKGDETQAELVNDFAEWSDDFIQPNNTREYRLELFGSYMTTPNPKLTSVVKLSVAFHEKAAVAGEYQHKQDSHKSNSPAIDVDKYISVATENATLRAQLERLEEKLDEFIEEDESNEEVGATEPQTLIGAINSAVISKLDTIIDIVLMKLTAPSPAATTGGIGAIYNETLEEFRTIYADIDEDLARLLTLAKTQPDFFKMLIKSLRGMIK